MLSFNFLFRTCKTLLLVTALLVSGSVAVLGAGLDVVSSNAVSLYPYNTVGRVVANSGEIASGVMIADNLVLTSARAFRVELQKGANPSSFSWKNQNTGNTYQVESLELFDNVLTVAQNMGFDSSAALQRDLMILELKSPQEQIPSATMNLQNLNSKAFRMVVGYADDLYSSGASNQNQLHATNSGESVQSSFGKVEGRLYHSGDLKASDASVGAPVFVYYDGRWSVDGVVVMNDVVDGACLVVGFDAEVSEFIDSQIETHGSKKVLSSDEFNVDANGSIKSALPLTAGEGRLFSISPSMDVDYHKFTVPSEGNYLIESFGSIDVNGALLNDQGQLMVDDDDSAASVNYRIDTLLKPGTYYLLTKPDSAEVIGSYGISLTNTDVVDTDFGDLGVESNGLIRLDPNEGNQRFQIGKSGQVDTFEIAVSSPGHFILETEGDLDLKTKLFSVAGGASVPYQGSDIEVLFDRNDDFPSKKGNSVLDAFLQSGNYIVTVEARNSGEYGPYQVSTRILSDPLEVIDSDDGVGSFASAEKWSIGKQIERVFDISGERDSYLFDIEKSRSVQFEIVSSASVVWYLYNQNLERVAGSEIAVSNPSIDLDLIEGSYYLVIVGSAAAEYKLD